MPDLAEQDDRRAVGAPAQRAGLVPSPLAIADPPKVLVITGPSGVGKGTLIRGLLECRPEFRLSVSATTRAPRAGETQGVDYHFLSDEEFERRLQAGEFLEWAEYSGNRYGTLRSEIERAAGGLVLEIELQGARQVREALPEARQVFIAPPSLEALKPRLVGRATDTPEQIERRLDTARRELEARSEFDSVVVNDRLEDAVAELCDLAATMWGPASDRSAP